MKKLTLILIFTSITFGLFSQEFEIPKGYSLEVADDYAKYENDIIKCIDWLMETPINEQASKRKDANAFLLKWMSGSPYMHLEIKQEIVTFMTTPELLMVFMGGWTKYSLVNKDFDNQIAGSIAGIDAVIEFYSKNKQFIKKDRNVEKYIKMKNKETLKEYVEKNA